MKYHGEHSLQGDGPVSAPGEHDLNSNENGASMQQTLTAVSADTKERDWVTELRDHMESTGQTPDDDDGDFYGDDFSSPQDPSKVGCRVMEINVGAGLAKDHNRTSLYEWLRRSTPDIAVVQEVGKIDKIHGIIERELQDVTDSKGKPYHPVFCDEKGRPGEGTMIIMGQDWHDTMTQVKPYDDPGYGRNRLVQVNFTAALNTVQRGDHREELVLIAPYGYANKSGLDKKRHEALIKATSDRIKKARETHRWATIMVAGDLNSAGETRFHTDKEAEAGEMEPDHHFLTALTAVDECNLRDGFSSLHPDTRAVSRHPQGKHEEAGHAKRRLDHILVDVNTMRHMTMRAGIAKTTMLTGGDHAATFVDIPTDCCGITKGITPLWKARSTEVLRIKETHTDQDVTDWNTRFRDKMEGQWDGPDAAKMALDALAKEANGTICEGKRLVYPRPAQAQAKRDGWGTRLDTWVRHMKGALHHLRRHEKRKTKMSHKKARRLLGQRLTWQWKEGPEGLHRDSLHGIADEYDANADASGALRTRIAAQLATVVEHNKQADTKLIGERMKKASARRKQNGSDPTGRGKGRELAAIFRVARQYRALRVVRTAGGDLETDEAKVSETVRRFFQSWMASRIPIQARWGTWEKMLKMSTEDMPEEYKTFVQECYLDEYEENTKRASEEGWYDNLKEALTISEFDEAIAHASRNTAPGPTKVTNDMIRLLDRESRLLLLAMMQEWITNKAVPDAINVASLRLLPKTEQGLSDLAKTRPIALMETLLKMFEHMIVGRILQSLMKHEVLDLSQYGALPDGGTAAPLRILTAMMDDARESAQPLHLLVADLSKAFDSMEYWSQGMTWKCLALPDDMIELMVNLDKGSDEGEGATTRVCMAPGVYTEPFRHGRGVRQGSMGGPLKWVVFVHFWIKWVKKKMAGEGYKMWASTQPTIPEAGRAEKPEAAEVLGMMFVDDSIWPMATAGASEAVARMHQQFCAFHGIALNTDKSMYVTMNSQGTQTRWAPTAGGASNPEESRGRRRLNDLGFTPEDSDKREARRIAEEMTKGAPITDESQRAKNPSFQYLGVWLNVEQGWSRQRSKMEALHNEMMRQMHRTRATTDMTRYAINCKVIPTMLYALQVAAMPEALIRQWDSRHRRVLAKAAKLPSSLPTTVYHLPTEDYGLGLDRLADRMAIQHVKMDMEALNDEHLGKGEASTQAKVIRASWRHHGMINKNHASSLCSTVEAARKRLGVVVVETPVEMRLENVARADEYSARAAECLQQATVYTDGSTLGGGKASGWGWAHTDNEATLKREQHDRLRGQQDNYTAEATALLQTLRSFQPSTHLDIYIDNQATVKRSGMNLLSKPRKRIKDPARATWNRITSMIDVRRHEGTKTNIHWVHAHVDKEDKGDKQSKPNDMQCACGAEKGKCDPQHKHHVGNELADAAAKSGAKQAPSQTAEDCRCGEERYHLTRLGQVCQGSIPAELKKAAKLGLLQEMRFSDKRTIRGMSKAIDLSDPLLRKHVANNAGVSKRFLSRAIAEALPTYKQQAQRVGESKDGTYNKMYGELLEEGQCRVCNTGEIETIQHVMCGCQHESMTLIRDSARKQIDEAWKKIHNNSIHRLTRYDHTETQNEWLGWWGWIGLVPVMENCERSASENKAMKETAKISAKAGHDMWTQRCELVRKWEETTTIAAAKIKQKRQKAPAHAQPIEKTGRARARKHKAELSSGYRRKLEREEYLEAATAAGEAKSVAEEKLRVQPSEEWLDAHPERVRKYAEEAAKQRAYKKLKTTALTPAALAPQRPVKRTAHEVDLDDVVDLHVQTGKKVRGYVSAVIYNGREGFRPPDAVEVTVNERGTETQYEASVQGQWTMVAKKRDRSARANACREEVKKKLQRASPENQYENLTESLPKEMLDTEEPLWLINARKEYNEPTKRCGPTSFKRQKTAEPSLGAAGATRRKNIKRARDTKEANAAYAILNDGQTQESDQQPGELLPGERGDKETQAKRQRHSKAERQERKRAREEFDEQRRQAEEEWLPSIEIWPPSPHRGGSGQGTVRGGHERGDTEIQTRRLNTKHPDTGD